MNKKLSKVCNNLIIHYKLILMMQMAYVLAMKTITQHYFNCLIKPIFTTQKTTDKWKTYY